MPLILAGHFSDDAHRGTPRDKTPALRRLFVGDFCRFFAVLGEQSGEGIRPRLETKQSARERVSEASLFGGGLFGEITTGGIRCCAC